jgi:fructose-1,6-bisphosphatase II
MLTNTTFRRIGLVSGKGEKRSGRIMTKANYGGPNYKNVQHNIALDLVRVTEAAALASTHWLGKGDKNRADESAVNIMRNVLNTIDVDARIVIGEGEKDDAPMLYRGEMLGNQNHATKVDIAVDPLDGTSLIAHGRNGAVSVIAMAERGALYDSGSAFYMEKLAVGPDVPPNSISLDYPIEHNLKMVSSFRRKPMDAVTVVMLDRPRHTDLIAQCRRMGVRIRLISDGDVAAAIEVAKDDASIDVMMGVGGSPEGVIAACALKIMGGSIQTRLWAKDDEERERLLKEGYNLEKIMTTNDLCSGSDINFAMTGCTDSNLVRGVRFVPGGAITHSLAMRSNSGTVRYIESHHKWTY